MSQKVPIRNRKMVALSQKGFNLLSQSCCKKMPDCTISMRAMLNLVWPPHPTSPLPQFLGQDLVHLYPCVMFYQCLKIDFMTWLPPSLAFQAWSDFDEPSKVAILCQKLITLNPI